MSAEDAFQVVGREARVGEDVKDLADPIGRRSDDDGRRGRRGGLEKVVAAAEAPLLSDAGFFLSMSMRRRSRPRRSPRVCTSGRASPT